VIVYSTCSLAKCNAFYYEVYTDQYDLYALAIVAMCDVKVGEEILCSYNHHFWLPEDRLKSARSTKSDEYLLQWSTRLQKCGREAWSAMETALPSEPFDFDKSMERKIHFDSQSVVDEASTKVKELLGKVSEGVSTLHELLQTLKEGLEEQSKRE
jgi:hypothetical protein